jgi:hypothetical protein
MELLSEVLLVDDNATDAYLASEALPDDIGILPHCQCWQR